MDREKLEGLSAQELRHLWENAKRLAPKREDARLLSELIESSGLNYRAGKTASVSLDDAIGRTMRRVIFSDEGRASALAAHNQGIPPLAGVDPLLHAALKADYGPHNEATIQAGYLVTQLMKGEGYTKHGSAALPSGCIAKSGALFVSGNGDAG